MPRRASGPLAGRIDLAEPGFLLSRLRMCTLGTLDRGNWFSDGRIEFWQFATNLFIRLPCSSDCPEGYPQLPAQQAHLV
jgi:hypothetical protein